MNRTKIGLTPFQASITRLSVVSAILTCGAACADDDTSASSTDLDPFERGPYSVGSTNMEVASEFADIGDAEMHEYLLGRPEESGRPRYVADILKHPESAWITDVEVPGNSALYGPASGMNLPVVTFVAFPASVSLEKNSYAFPYYDAQYGEFENMLGEDESPSFADPDDRYPLILIAHGSEAHGVFDVRHAHSLASHGYIVAVINYGDERTKGANTISEHVMFLRPLITKAVLDSLLDSDVFGPRIDTDNIGITGHSFGGFTALAITGGPILGNSGTVHDERIKAGVLAAPWVGGNYDENEYYAFGANNSGLEQVHAPVLCLFGTKDEVTVPSYILPATRQLSGPTYVVELVDQPHVFEQGSWEDRDNWELLFFSAYLKNDPEALEKLRTGVSMKGGNEDFQLIDYQRPTGRD